MINPIGNRPYLAGIVILAGGASSRMGTPKAQLLLPTGESLLDYHVRQAAELNVPIMVADNERGFQVSADLLLKHENLPILYIPDYGSKLNAENSDKQKSTGGALVAIASALQSMSMQTNTRILANKQDAWLMVMSCDSLVPAMQLWQKLQSSMTQSIHSSVVCLTDDTHLYPLLGLYRLSLELDLVDYLDRGERQVMKFIQHQVQPIALPKNWQHLTNFNTPEQFKQACAALNDL